MEHEIEKWKRELKEAGWRQYRYRGHDYAHMWVSPKGEIYRGPYGAWRMMESMKQWPDQKQTAGG